MTDQPVPTALPTEATFRVGWEVIVSECTLRIRKPEPAPDDSDGIPQAVDAEVSVQSSRPSGHVTAQHFELSDAGKVNVLGSLCELAWRDGKGDLMSYPFLVPDPDPDEPRVRMLVHRWHEFTVWLLDHAWFNFDAIGPLVRGLPFHARRGGLAFLGMLAGVVQQTSSYHDTPYLLLKL